MRSPQGWPSQTTLASRDRPASGKPAQKAAGQRHRQEGREEFPWNAQPETDQPDDRLAVCIVAEEQEHQAGPDRERNDRQKRTGADGTLWCCRRRARRIGHCTRSAASVTTIVKGTVALSARPMRGDLPAHTSNNSDAPTDEIAHAPDETRSACGNRARRMAVIRTGMRCRPCCAKVG